MTNGSHFDGSECRTSDNMVLNPFSRTKIQESIPVECVPVSTVGVSCIVASNASLVMVAWGHPDPPPPPAPPSPDRMTDGKIHCLPSTSLARCKYSYSSSDYTRNKFYFSTRASVLVPHYRRHWKSKTMVSVTLKMMSFHLK